MILAAENNRRKTSNAQQPVRANMPRGNRSMQNGRVAPRNNTVANSRPAPAKQNPRANIPKGNPDRSRMNIKSQTPSQRKSAKEAKRINPSSPEVRSVPKKQQGFAIKKQNKKARRAMIARFFLFLLIFAVTFSVFCLAFSVSLKSVPKAEYKNISVKIGVENDAELKGQSLPYESFVRNGVFYLDMTEIADKFGFTTTGDHKELRFITDFDSGEYVRFELGSSFADINGTTVRLEKETYIQDGHLYVPQSFFDSYVNGIEIEFDGEKKELLILRQTEKNILGKLTEVDIGFKLKAMRAEEFLDESELSQEIKDKTYFVNQSPMDPPATQ